MPRPAPAGARGWRAAAPRSACVRRSARSPRTARRTCRAARRRAARRAPASRSTTSSARPTESASSASCSGSSPARGRDRLGHVRAQRLLAPRLARAQHVQADPRDHRGQPAAEVLDARRRRRGSAAARPPGPRRPPRSASRACGRPPPAGGPGWPRTARPAIFFVHRSHSFVAFRQGHDEREPADVTKRGGRGSSNTELIDIHQGKPPCTPV